MQALVGNLVDVDAAGGTVNINATATPQAKASSFGVNAGLAAVGASIAEATSSANVNATLGAGADVTASGLTVSANRLAPAGSVPTAWADASGASGGLVGVNATSGTATSGGGTSARASPGICRDSRTGARIGTRSMSSGATASRSISTRDGAATSSVSNAVATSRPRSWFSCSFCEARAFTCFVCVSSS